MKNTKLMSASAVLTVLILCMAAPMASAAVSKGDNIKRSMGNKTVSTKTAVANPEPITSMLALAAAGAGGAAMRKRKNKNKEDK